MGAVSNAPPKGVMDMKLVGGLRYQGDEFVVGKRTKLKTYVCCGVVGIAVKASEVKTVAVVDIL
jgi:hypothetical protein